MKPTDPKRKFSNDAPQNEAVSDTPLFERETTSIPENAAMSRLSRVVDVSALMGKSHARCGDKHAKRDKKNRTPAPAQPQDAPQKKRHTDSGKRDFSTPSHDPSQNSASTARLDPSPSPLSTKRADDTPNIPQRNPSPNATASASTASTQAPQTNGSKTRRPLRVSGKQPHIKRTPAPVAKTPKFLSHKKIDTSRSEHQTEKIEDALLLQSWRARQWSESITKLSPTIVMHMQDSMPLVQAGLVNNICITPGRLEATIFDQVVSITLRQFTQGQWKNVVDMLSDRAIFATSLLNGELPEGIIDIFKQANLSLFPTKIREFTFTCDCEPETAPCEHACALLIAFAQMLEEDPFHILTLRGMTRDALLQQLRDARSDQIVDEKNRNRINYEIPAQNIDFADFYHAKGDFSSLSFHIAYTPNSLLKRLGDPKLWNAGLPLDLVLSPIAKAAAHEAELLGQCEHYELVPDSDDPQQPLPPPTHTNSPSRAPKTNSHSKKITMPDMRFIQNALPQEILDEFQGDPVLAAEDIMRWLKTRGASDIRTLARRTRLHKSTIEAFLNAFCNAGLTRTEMVDEKMRYTIVD